MLTRRQFIQRLLAMGISATSIAAFLQACTPQAAVSTATPILPSPTSAPPPTAAATSTTASALPEAPASPTPQPISGEAYLAVARGDDPAELTRRAVKAIGGMERFVKPGQSVIVKPNICVAYHSPEYAATTNPQVVAALVTLCLEAGASTVSVMDNPFGGTPQEAYKISQIGEAVGAAGGEMVVMSRIKFKSTKIPQGKDIKDWLVFQDALKADVIIDVPIAKHHNLARLTLAAKNLMGLVENRSSLHSNLGERLVDLVTLFKPKLIVIDAYRMLMAHGPTGGSLNDVKLMKTVIASHDIVAADAYAATLFDLRPEQIAYVKAGAERGLGTMDLQSIKIKEINV